MIDAANLRKSIVDAIADDTEVIDYCIDRFGAGPNVFAGIDIDASAREYPMVVVRVPKTSYDAEESGAVVLIDLAVEGGYEPRDDGGKEIYDTEALLNGLAERVIRATLKASAVACDMDCRQWQWEEDLMVTVPVYTGFVVFDLYKTNTI